MNMSEERKNINVVVGLDIGTTKIACFIGRETEHEKLEILSMGRAESIGVTRGVVANLEQTVNSIKKAVQEAQDRLEGDLVIKSVNVGIAGQHIGSIQHRGMIMRDNLDTEVCQADLDKLIEDALKLSVQPGDEIIHVLPQEWIIDGEPGIKNPVGHAGMKVEANLHVITGNVVSAKNINKCVEMVGLSISQMVLEPLASSEAVLSHEEKESGVVLVDIGGGTTDVAIFHDDVIKHTAVIPFGGNVITDDIKQGCSILKKNAEQLKVKFGSALQSESQDNEIVCIPSPRGRAPKEISIKNLAGIIQARVEEIIEHVHYEIKNSGCEKDLTCGIVITGGGAQLNHITQLFEFITGMDTRIGYPNEHLAPSTTIEGLTSPIYSTGIGLVLKGIQFDKARAKKLAILEKTNPEMEKESTVKGHSKGKIKGKFFTNVLDKAKEWFEEED
jgi:cell division protein FtsA